MFKEQIVHINFGNLSEFAKSICKQITIGTIILLEGDLGSGKTTLSRYIIKSIFNNNTIEIKSPTFSILEYYKFNNTTLCHYDLYRIKHKIELEEINILDNILSSITIIEWPQIANDILTKFADQTIRIQISQDRSIDTERKLKIITTNKFDIIKF